MNQRLSSGRRPRRIGCARVWFISMSPLEAVEIVPGDDRRTGFRVFVGGAVVWILTAPNAGTRIEGFDKLDVEAVVRANTTSIGVVLTSCIVGVQSVECLGSNTPSDCKPKIGMSHQGGGGSLGGKVEATHVGRSVPHRSRFGSGHCSRSREEVGLLRQRIYRRTNSMFPFRRLITVESQNPRAGLISVKERHTSFYYR